MSLVKSWNMHRLNLRHNRRALIAALLSRDAGLAATRQWYEHAHYLQ